jgi:hypothetical protein
VVSDLGHAGLVLPSGEKTRGQLNLVVHWRIEISREQITDVQSSMNKLLTTDLP